MSHKRTKLAPRGKGSKSNAETPLLGKFLSAKFAVGALALGIAGGGIFYMSSAGTQTPPAPSQTMEFPKEFSELLAINTPKRVSPKMISEIEQKRDEIFKELEIRPATNETERVLNAYKIFCYVTKNSTYNADLIGRADDEYRNLMKAEIAEIHTLLLGKESVCTGDAATCAYLLRESGDETAKNVTFAKHEDHSIEGHAACVIKIADEEYVLDATLFRTALEKKEIEQIEPTSFAIPRQKYYDEVLAKMDERWNVGYERPPVKETIENIKQEQMAAVEK